MSEFNGATEEEDEYARQVFASWVARHRAEVEAVTASLVEDLATVLSMRPIYATTGTVVRSLLLEAVWRYVAPKYTDSDYGNVRYDLERLAETIRKWLAENPARPACE